MRIRTVALAAGLSLGLTQSTDAFAPHKGAERPFVASGLAPRQHRAATFVTTTLAAHGLDGWRAIWDRDTDVPARLWGAPIAAPGAMANPAIAESVARAFLAQHLSLLAPGAQITDFVLVSNQLGGFGDVRSVGFAQTFGGLRVVGGTISFAFKNDRLIMVGSTALPRVAITKPLLAIEPARIGATATAWLATAGVATTVTALGNRVILPIVRPRARGGLDIRYHVADTVELTSTGEPGRWNVWVSADTGAAIARESTIRFSTGTVSFDVPDRWPGGTRTPKAAPNDTHTVNGAATTSNANGVVSWATTAAATVAPGLTGPLVAITNKAGALVTDSLSLAVGGSVTWSKATDGPSDAQLDAFVFASTAKAFVKAKLNPNLAWLNQQLSVNVNENSTCNAFSNGDDIHFFKANTMCENTGRLADVVYHEFGHSVHNNSIIPGVGAFDGSLSEGLADTMASSITLDHGMGRGFFFNNDPLRDLDPVGVEKKWPQDADGEVHDEGEIIGEAIWDLRTALNAKLGAAAGFTATEKIYYGIMQRAHDIPTSSYAEALVADDDDGNLMNGTPNQCEINAAFGLHGLADPSVTIGLAPPTRDSFTVSLSVTPPTQTACPPPNISGVTLDWQPRGGGTGGSVQMTANGNTWSGVIPTQPDGTVVQYKVTVTLGDGSTTLFPDNKADPLYEFYVGNVVPIKCFDFEAGAADWTHTATGGTDEWEAGIPKGLGGDPAAAHGGTAVFGIDLGTAGNGDGIYSSSLDTSAESSDIDLQGHTNVRLQYYRWLGVEDGAYDHATISANGTQVWTNFASPGMPTSNEVNHVDKEWRFQDVDLSAQATTGTIKLKFGLTSDPGLELGGWTIDDVCIVAPTTGPTCGNGIMEDGEQCDDGNTTDGDGCSASCEIEGNGGGCCSSSGSPAGPAGLGALVLGLVLRRRRRQ